MSARLIPTDLFRRQATNPSLTRADTLRQAMLYLLDRGEKNDPHGGTTYTYAQPIFRAPFSLVGDGGR